MQVAFRQNCVVASFICTGMINSFAVGMILMGDDGVGHQSVDSVTTTNCSSLLPAAALNSVGLLMDDDTTRFSLNGSQQVMMGRS